MQHHSEKSIFELVTELGEKLAERRRLLEESLPPQLRKDYAGDPVIIGPCEVERSFGYDPTGENAEPCGTDGIYYPDVEAILCPSCRRAVC